MQKFHRDITLGRLKNFFSRDRFSDVNLYSCLYYESVDEEPYLKLSVYNVPDLKRIPFEEATSSDKTYAPARKGDAFGPTWSTHWFRLDLTLPSPWNDREVHLLWDTDSEGLVFSEDGVPLQGLTGGNGNDRRAEYVVTGKSVGGTTYVLYVEMAANGLFGAGRNGMINAPDMNRYYTLKTVELSCARPVAWQLLWRFQVLLGMAKDLPAESQQACDALFSANKITNTFRRDDEDGGVASMKECLRIADEFFAQRTGGEKRHRITAVGNCHIDTAWLWPFDETKRKVARSWATQVTLMDRYPDYVFVASQMQQFEWLEDGYPKLMLRVREKFRTGQFLAIGGTWVENDCNMPSGEALCRQFLFGQRSMKRIFGKYTKVFWLPDTFGYAAQLPQIVRLTGARYFFTQKLSWNNINKFPHTSFYWVGLDGSRCLTHMAPAETYCAEGEVHEMIKSCNNNRDKCFSNSSMLLYGNGDGGGGPNANMIERIKCMKDIDGIPKVEMGSPDEFYENLEKDSPDLISWKGELYFELHRGTYTTHADMKRSNRFSELLLRDVELVAVFASMKSSDYKYPKEELDRLWKLTLLNQFHDVLPGTAIEIVYEDARKFYADVCASGTKLRDEALSILVSCGGEPKTQDVMNRDFLSFNTLAWSRKAVVKIPAPESEDVIQLSSDGKSAFALCCNIPGFGAQLLDCRNPPNVTPCSVVEQNEGQSYVLENQHLRAVFDKHGRLESLRDAYVNREVIVQGQLGNRFRLYEDIPLFWDAWDVEVYHMEKGKDAGLGVVKVLEKGPLRASLAVEYQLTPRSKCRQLISLDALSKVLEFDCEVEWNENRQFLKVEFPFDILSDVATYETQFGHIQRPTHFNTSWDMARFEVCGHKWADLSQTSGRYGVSLLNDCKYGYATHGNVMKLSLIRSPKSPDEHCDIGRHMFRYGVYSHQGTFCEADVVRAAYEFNVPLIVTSSTGFCDHKPYFELCGSKSVILDTVKRAEDSNATVLRLYDAYGEGCTVTLKISGAFEYREANICNLLEEEERVLDWEDDWKDVQSLRIDFKPFQVVTVKLET